MDVYEFKGVRIFYERERVQGSDLFITGFKGYGAVGYITTLHLVETLNCEPAGYIVTRYMPEAVTPAKKGVMLPFSLYSCRHEGRRIVVLVNNDIPLPQERTRFAEAVIRFLRETIPEAVLVGGFDSRFKEGSESFRWVATSSYRREVNAPRMSSGLYVIGPLALLLMFAEIYNYPAIAVLPYTEAARPDPRAAAEAIRVIGELYGITVDVRELLEQAKKIEETIMRLEAQQREAAISPASERAYM